MADLDVEVAAESPVIKLFGAIIVAEEESHQSKSLLPTVAEPDEDDASAALPCPRCSSRETKFCYFNNYNVNQPRHFCKACHRYWTAGGILRNVPPGARRRRNPLSPRGKSVS